MDLPPPSIEVLPPAVSAPPLVVGQPEPPVKKPEPVEEVEPNCSTWRGLVLDAVTYTVRKGGMFILLPGAVLGVLLAIGMLAPILGFGAMIAMGYFSAYYMEVVTSTINGANRMPDWPNVSSVLDDIVQPVLQLAAAGVIAVLPLILYSVLVSNPEDQSEVVLFACKFFGHCYLPMAVLSTCFHGNYRSVLPDYVLPAIARSLPGYLLAVLLLLLLDMTGELATSAGEAVPFIGSLLIMLASPYLFFTQGRIVGLIYRRYQDRIGW